MDLIAACRRELLAQAHKEANRFDESLFRPFRLGATPEPDSAACRRTTKRSRARSRIGKSDDECPVRAKFLQSLAERRSPQSAQLAQ